MPALLDTLQSSFTSGGFDLGSTLGGLSSAATGIAPQAASLDTGALGQIGQQLGQGNFAAIGASVESVLGQTAQVAGALPDAQALLAPLHGALTSATQMATADPRQVLAAFEQAASVADGQQGMAALAGPLAALPAVRSNPLVDSALRLLTTALPGGLPLDTTIARSGPVAVALAALVRLLGALMSTEALAGNVLQSTQSIGRMLDGPTADAALTALQGAAGSDLAALIAAAAPDDPVQVDATLAAVTEFAEAIRGAGSRLVSGMAFGEAALVSADLDQVATGIDQAAGLLTEAALDPVRRLATEVAGWVSPLLRFDLGTPAASVDAFVSELTSMVTQLAASIDALDPVAIARPVSRGLTAALTPLHELDAIAHQVSAAIRSALQTVQQAISSVDLRPVTQAIQAATQPVLGALNDLEQLIGAAQTELETLASDVTAALTTLRQTLDTAAHTIQTAFGRVAGVVNGLNLAQLVSSVQSEIQAVAGTLASAQVQPYFNTAIQALNGAASTISAVPLSLLPDDLKQQLDDAVKPIKDIDFNTDVRQVLEDQLDAILTSLSTDVLNEIDQAYQAVVAFLHSIDPHPPLQQFEHDDFDPLLARLQAIDPTALLAPVSDLIARVKAVVAGIDLSHDVLAPLERAFDSFEQLLSGLNPATLLQPLEQEVGQLRGELSSALHLAQLEAWVALIDPAVTRLLARLDFTTLVALLDAAWAHLMPAPEPPATSPLATVVSGLLEGTGLNIRMDSFAAVARWVGGADASSEVSSALVAAAAAVDETVTVLERVDPRALVSAVQPAYTAVSGAVAALPPTSLLRLQLEPVLAGADPMELLGTAVDNRDRYLAGLRAVQAALHALAASARSELTAVAHGLRDALRPLVVIPDRIKAVLMRVGLTITPGKTLRELVTELLDLFTPAGLLAPLAPAVDALKTKLAALVHSVLVVPAGDALSTVGDALTALDISFVRIGLQGLHDQITADIDQFRPSTLLAPVLTTFAQTQATIAAFDPLAPVRAAIDAMKAAIADLAANYRPTVLLVSVLAAYDAIVKSLGTLDVHQFLDPVLKALADIKTQLDTGLDGTAKALTSLQAALP